MMGFICILASWVNQVSFQFQSCCCCDSMRNVCSDGDHLMLCRLQMTEAALALSEQKTHNMGELLTQVKVEKEEQLERWSREKKKELEAWTHLIRPIILIR